MPLEEQRAPGRMTTSRESVVVSASFERDRPREGRGCRVVCPKDTPRGEAALERLPR